MKMLGKVKIAATAVVAASLFSNVSYGLEAGDVAFNSVNGTCQPSPLTGYPWATETTFNVPIIMGNITSGSTNNYYISMTSAISPGNFDPQNGSLTGVTENAYSWMYVLNMVTNQYTLLGAGISGAGSVTGTFTGSITENIYGQWSINLTLNCGATIVGGAFILGS